MKRQPQVSQGQINRGLCGIRGCPAMASRYSLILSGQKVPVCSEHRRTAHDSQKPKSKGARK